METATHLNPSRFWLQFCSHTAANFQINTPGLFYGNMGQCLFFYLLHRQTGKRRYEMWADMLIDKIHARQGDFLTLTSFDNGIAGVGWGIEFLIRNGLIKGNSNDILEDFDMRIFKYLNEYQINSCDLEKGLTGYLLYVSSRLKSVSGDDSRQLLKDLLILIINKLYSIVQSQYASSIKNMDFDLLNPCPVLFYGLTEAAGLNIYNDKIRQLFIQMLRNFDMYKPLLNINKLYMATILQLVLTKVVPDKRLQRQVNILLYSIDFQNIKYEIDAETADAKTGVYAAMRALNLAMRMIPPTAPQYVQIAVTFDEVHCGFKQTLDRLFAARKPDDKFNGLTAGLYSIAFAELLSPMLSATAPAISSSIIAQSLTYCRIFLPDSIAATQQFSIDGLPELEPVRQESITANNADIQTDTANYTEKYGFDLSQSERCNFLAHRTAWKHFMQSNATYCLFIENNTEINTMASDIALTISELPENWDVFFPYDKDTLAENHLSQPDGKTTFNDNTWEYSKPEAYLHGYKFGNSIYLLSRSGADKLLKISTITDRLDHILIGGTLNLCQANVPWLKLSQLHNYEWPDRSRLMLKAAIDACGWTTERLACARKLLKTVSDIARKTGINLVIDAGTLLSYVRHGGIMLWDDDFDLGIEDSQMPAMLRAVGKNRALQWGKFDFRGTPYFKVWFLDGEPVKNFPYSFPFVDLWAYHCSDGKIAYENRNVYPEAPLIDIAYEGIPLKMPANAPEILDSRYADWRTTIRVYTLSHREETFRNRYFCIPITTDINGKMIG
jgi:GR25 family glycosyltransferase involved in LPS biosynthesis